MLCDQPIPSGKGRRLRPGSGPALRSTGLLLGAMLAVVSPAAAQQAEDPEGFEIRRRGELEAERPKITLPADEAMRRQLQAKQLQTQRLQFVEEAINQKILTRFSQDIPRCELWTGPRFERLRPVHQTQVASVPWTYCRAISDKAHTLLLRDGKTNHQIGMFTKDGLELF